MSALNDLDDPVAPVPDVLLAVAEFGPEAPPVGIAPDIQEVPAPPLAVLRRGQQLIDYLLVSIRRRVVEERCRLFGRRRQADEIEVHAAKQYSLVGGRDRRQPLFFPPRGDEPVDRIPHFEFRIRTSGIAGRTACGTTSGRGGRVPGRRRRAPSRLARSTPSALRSARA